MVKHINRVVTGAHYGLRDWLIQRVTAIIMSVYVLLLVIFVNFMQIDDYAGLKSFFSHQWVRVITFLFFISLCWHAWVGVRNVLMDYVHVISLRLTLHIAVIISLFGYVIWFAEILWGQGGTR
ncbi:MULTISPECIES: succinate dehydrogenase, hydrophobic membrane anchor protein [Nitrosomonas]|uniref:succinate dehydrogenase, hydrophobic membrane anchor protein n=1 Tax=Nitrosomonas TaxID=914 RepID=UPI0023F8D64D|nr:MULTISPECIES: succinate dehydrogenase, hydrophobic membrane anchor protein [Nitrosomonas]MCO6433362.1 succinate dehydrogenase, hydrophobic membrane anchor protein [Nitrosomonas nitrosa]MCW5599333.1 succinate dehydrogenase, hydrophobic membrane anchor protein [Nitrosomonas sp.]MCW5602708.1 succinate dehydrogenase, hydrophobic membrane anchor protein [Nitrosomonas sp.]